MKKGNIVVVSLLMALSFLIGMRVPGNQPQTKQTIIQQTLMNKWYFADKEKDLESRLSEQALSGMTYLPEDPYTNYLNKEDAAQFNESVNGNNASFGFLFGFKQDQLVVEGIMEDSPAQKAGLLPGDIIVNISGQTGSVYDQLKKAKTQVEKTFRFDIERDGQATSLKMKPKEGEYTVAYAVKDGVVILTITTFGESTADQIRRLAKSFERVHYQKLIIDLRNNGGGLIEASRQIASVFLDDHTFLYYLQQTHGSKQKIYSSGKPIWQPDIIILQNDQTASASEMLVASLQDQKQLSVKVIGSASYGKNRVQDIIPFKDGTSFKYTSALWFPKNKANIYHKGIQPDIEVTQPTIEAASLEETIQPDTVNQQADALQRMLQSLGYPVARTDQYYASSEAMKAFEQDHQLTVDGVVSPEDYQAVWFQAYVKSHQMDQDETLNQALEVIRQ